MKAERNVSVTLITQKRHSEMAKACCRQAAPSSFTATTRHSTYPTVYPYTATCSAP